MALAARGMKIVAATPSARHTSATAIAWLPAEIVVTPRARSSAVMASTRFVAPRSLNEPPRWNSSALISTSCPARADRAGDGSSGVRTTRPASVRAAASTS